MSPIVAGQRCVNTLPHDQPRKRLMDQNLEQWRPVVGYEGLYEVSNHGRVRSLDRAVRQYRGGVEQRKGRIKRLSILREGYLGTSLSKGGKNVQKRVHILVAEAFLPPRPEWSNMVNHINKDRADNRVENLEWSDNGHNKRHANARYLYKDRLVSCTELAEISGIAMATLFSRINYSGWSVEQSVSTPIQRGEFKALKKLVKELDK
jgi:NUMOD4 motif/HNH endonuclease